MPIVITFFKLHQFFFIDSFPSFRLWVVHIFCCWWQWVLLHSFRLFLSSPFSSSSLLPFCFSLFPSSSSILFMFFFFSLPPVFFSPPPYSVRLTPPENTTNTVTLMLCSLDWYFGIIILLKKYVYSFLGSQIKYLMGH